MDYLSEYNPDWPVWFRRIAQYLRTQLTDCVRIEHVGSTSIVGMVAKPIIDIDIVVLDGTMSSAVSVIEQAGYFHQGDLGLIGREAFQSIVEATQRLPTHHLYACEVSSFELRKHVSFREYLSAHPPEALRLSDFKRSLAFEQKLSRSAYIQAKSDFVREISTNAVIWYDGLRPTHKSHQSGERHLLSLPIV